MTINLDLVIDTEEDSVDMKTALESMQGVSDTVICIAEAVLTEKISKRHSHKGKVRTSLKSSFKGSYGHIFSLDIYDQKLVNKLNGIGRPAFIELVTYFEPPRVLRRLQILREWSHEQNKKIFPRSKRTSSPSGTRASQ